MSFLLRANPLRVWETRDYRRFLNAGNKLGRALAVKAEITLAPGLGLPSIKTCSNFFVDNSSAGLQYRVPKINNIHKQKHAGHCNPTGPTRHA